MFGCCPFPPFPVVMDEAGADIIIHVGHIIKIITTTQIAAATTTTTATTTISEFIYLPNPCKINKYSTLGLFTQNSVN